MLLTLGNLGDNMRRCIVGRHASHSRHEKKVVKGRTKYVVILKIRWLPLSRNATVRSSWNMKLLNLERMRENEASHCMEVW